MGEQQVAEQADEERLATFMQALLADVVALEQLLADDRIEAGVRRIGAEQEMFLVDRRLRPAPLSLEVLERAGDARLTTELARFNLEANLTPLSFVGDCLRRLEAEVLDVVGRAAEAARGLGAQVVLTGILPTLRVTDLGLDSMTPKPRYHALNTALRRLSGGDFNVRIEGIDELAATHDNIMLESCNTSFQIHFQVGAKEFARLYNLAQAITAPVLAAAVNSPVLLRRRLWHETRIALFQRSVDTRPSARLDRAQKPRVHFGDRWVREGVLELFREDVARFRVVAAGDVDEDPRDVVDRGDVPELRALRIHNSTVYRWNRPCYGISDGIAHLRIENRALPAGPTVLDEVANAAFFYGLMAALSRDPEPIEKTMSFDDVRASFFAAARYGLRADLAWIGGRTVAAPALILELLPRARQGLLDNGIEPDDVARYLGVIEERVQSGQTGAQWVLRSLAGMEGQGTPEARATALCAAMIEHRKTETPGHRWPLAALADSPDTLRDSVRTVGQIMSTDLFTVRPGDIVDFAASVMDWRHVRHVPVEDDGGRLVGLVSHRALLRLMARGTSTGTVPSSGRVAAGPISGRTAAGPPTVASIMRPDPITVTPETPTLEAMRRMRAHGVGCLPVVRGDKLVGIVTERDLIDVSAKLLERYLADDA